MPALDFPNTPSNGDTFGQYIYDGVRGVWRLNPEAPSINLDNVGDVDIVSATNGQALIYDGVAERWENQNIDIPAGTTISATAPVSPEAGELWWNSNDGKLFIYYNDGNTSQWVDAAGPSVAVQSTAPTGYEGQLWLDDTDGSMYVYYTDPGGASSSWIGAVSRSGGILQVVSTTKTDTFSSTATTPTDITGATVSITPRSTSSKILLMFEFPVGMSNTTSAAIQLLRGTTVIGGGTVAGSRLSANSVVTLGGGNYRNQASGIFLDSPSTTSTTTYSLKAWGEGGTWYVGRSSGDTDSTSSAHARTPLTITAIEVAG